MSTRAIGDALGVADQTVRADLDQVRDFTQLPDRITGLDGKEYQPPAPHKEEPQDRRHEFRLLAEHKAGELLRRAAESGERASRGPEQTSDEPTLSDLGISRDQASRWQTIASLPSEV